MEKTDLYVINKWILYSVEDSTFAKMTNKLELYLSTGMNLTNNLLSKNHELPKMTFHLCKVKKYAKLDTVFRDINT